MVMQIAISQQRKAFTAVCLPFLLTLMFGFWGCKKTEPIAATTSNNDEIQGKKKNPPPPPPQPFYFNCGSPVINGSFLAGVPTNATITLTYVNSPGGPYATFTSSVVNGITLTAPAGTLNTGSGSIVFTASGTPINSGFLNIAVSINGSVSCPLLITVANAPVSGPNADPGTTPGSTGVVNFIYKGQSVAYKTVRAKDGKIWLQQNLGSPQVAFHEMDQASYGDYFQWGRWDDGHQTPNSPAITGGPSLLNPSNIPWGNSNFIKGTTAGTKWWGIGGVASDTWSDGTATATNGKDPCAALGAGWRLPTAAEWDNVAIYEDLFGTISAFQSNLKLPASGYRLSYDGGVYQNGDIGYYWTNAAADNSYAKVFFFDNVYNAATTTSERGQGFSCRCVKN
jgi:uncharacterized protein (TIGR02145 family)